MLDNFKVNFLQKGSVKTFNSSDKFSRINSSNMDNWWFLGRIFFLMSYFVGDCVFGFLMACHFITIIIVKAFTVDNFKTWKFINMFVHIIYAMNIASPAEDWDQGKLTVEEFKKKHQKVNKEMNWNISVNFIFALVMTCPLVYTGKIKICNAI